MFPLSVSKQRVSRLFQCSRDPLKPSKSPKSVPRLPSSRNVPEMSIKLTDDEVTSYATPSAPGDYPVTLARRAPAPPSDEDIDENSALSAIDSRRPYCQSSWRIILPHLEHVTALKKGCTPAKPSWSKHLVDRRIYAADRCAHGVILVSLQGKAHRLVGSSSSKY